MSAIDQAGQLIELPMEQTGAYLMQDGSTILSQPQLQTAAQGGKSLLKPELAQHLNQHVDYKTPASRGGFTMNTTDQRWMNINAPRPNRGLSRKPLGSNVGHMQPGSIVLSQSAALAPAASGLLSLGTRYTPSSVAAFSNNATSMSIGNAVVTPTGTSAGLMSTGLGMDRDQNYRLAAAIAGTGGRGRPRGRRPLRGQFPVVPIDMVRQLGIEQQVILQPAAPVAMRNKAVLCRPLSMSRKVQASVNAFESGSVDNMPSLRAVEDVDDLVLRKPVRKTDTSEIAIQSEAEDSSTIDNMYPSEPERRKTLNIDTSTQSETSPMDADSQTDIELPDENESTSSKVPKFVPIPIPVPIYVPVPVCLYARPIPYLFPFPLPCLLPLPIPLEESTVSVADYDDSNTLKTLDVEEITAQLPAVFDAASTEVDDSIDSPCDYSEENPPSLTNKPDCGELIISPESETSADDMAVSPEPGRNLKRLAPSSSPEIDEDEHQIIEDVVFKSSGTHQPVSTEPVNLPYDVSSSASHDSIIPPPKRPRHAIIVSDANYHLKFSYGINAWRHWVQQKLSSISSTGLSTLNHSPTEPNLKIDLLNISEPDLNLALSQFVREVRKPNNECYVADSIFYLCLGIQEYLNENGLKINIFGGHLFTDFVRALDDILANFQPRVSPEGLLICRIEEEHLWEARQLGDNSPEVLLFTVLYLNTKYFGLRVGTAHCHLSFSNFELLDADTPNSSLLCHLSETDFPGVEASTSALRLERNESFPERCPVHMITTYISRCPSDVHLSKDLFYLTPDYSHPHGDCWYSPISVSADELQISLNRIKMVKEIQEAFMNGQPDGGF